MLIGGVVGVAAVVALLLAGALLALDRATSGQAMQRHDQVGWALSVPGQL